jgi:hypothetical protein
MTRSCRRIQSQLSAFIDGELAPTRSRGIREHLDGCPRCRQVADQLRLLVGQSANLEDLQPPEDLFDRVCAAVQQKKQQRSAEARAGRWIWLALPGTAVAAGVAALFIFMMGSPSPAPQQPGKPRVVAKASKAMVPAKTSPETTESLMESVAREFRRAEAHYQKAVSQLRKLADEDSRSWPSGQRRVFAQNLGIIDRAVERYRQAARLDPVDPHPREVLFSAYRRQIHFLQDAILAGATSGTPGGLGRDVKPAVWSP